MIAWAEVLGSILVKNNEIEIEEVNVYTDDCGTTRKACVTDCIGGSALITPME